MELTIYSIVLLIFAIFRAYTSAITMANLHWGQKAAGIEQFKNIPNHVMLYGNRGFQDPFTSRFHKMRQNASIILTVAIIAIGFSIFKWYIPIIAYAVYFVTKGIIQAKVLPSPRSSYYKNLALKELEAQETFYGNRGNILKAQATSHFIDILKRTE